MDAKNSMLHKPVLQKTLDPKQAPILKRHKQSELQVQPRKKCRTTKSTLQLQEFNMWENLDSNILGEIFSHVPIQDVFLTVSSVCQSWEAACWDYLFWSRNVLDLSITGAGLGSVDISHVVSLLCLEDEVAPGIFGQLDSTEKNNDMSTCLMRKVRCIMEGQNMNRCTLQSWSNSIETVILPFGFEISDACLIYIAERTPCLQSLFLMCPSKITISGFTRAIQKWKHVKEIHVGPLDNDVFKHFIEEMGRNCQELATLHIHQKEFRVDEPTVQLMAKRLPGLKKIGFELAHVFPRGVLKLYNMCLPIEELHFHECRMTRSIEVVPELQNFFGNFRLILKNGGGYGRWELEPDTLRFIDIYIEDISKMLGLDKNTLQIEDFLNPEYYAFDKAKLQSDFERWIYSE